MVSHISDAESVLRLATAAVDIKNYSVDKYLYTLPSTFLIET